MVKSGSQRIGAALTTTQATKQTDSATGVPDALADVDTVVCLHGYAWPGPATYLIKRRLEAEHGLRALMFSYPSLRRSIDENAESLAEFLDTHGLESAHLLGHSLGGVVALRMLATLPVSLKGRVVCLGSPLTGSRAAEFVNTLDFADLFSSSLKAGVIDASANEWGREVCDTHDIGVIAGTVGRGLGRIVAGIKEENDGTIAVSETRLEGATDHLVMEVSHNRLLTSPAVIDQAASFLEQGRFQRD